MNASERTPMTEPDAPIGIPALVEIIREEVGVILSLYPDAVARQWSASPVPKPSEDTSQRSSGGRPSDPTGDTVLDARRLAVRQAVVDTERLLRAVARGVRDARVAQERAIVRFDGGA